jgi:hypothetical protein
MIDVVISWMLANPLQGVAALAGLGIAVGLLLVPGLHEITSQNHPRC